MLETVSARSGLPVPSSTLITSSDAAIARHDASVAERLLRYDQFLQPEDAESLSRQFGKVSRETFTTQMLAATERKNTRTRVCRILRALKDPKTMGKKRIYYADRLFAEEMQALHLEVIEREMNDLRHLLSAASPGATSEFTLAQTLPRNVKHAFLAGDEVDLVRVALEYAAGIRARLLAMAPTVMAGLGVNW